MLFIISNHISCVKLVYLMLESFVYRICDETKVKKVS